MPAPEAALAHYAYQQNVVTQITSRLQQLWASLDPQALDHSWTNGIGEEAFVTLSLGQQAAAAGADSYLDAVLSEQDIDSSAVATVQSRAFAGVAADGRNLETLLYEPIIAAKVAFNGGADLAHGLAVGAASMDRIGATQVADAGRESVGAGLVARQAAGGYTRMLNPPSCGRCAILAGRFYRWNRGFLRHPKCDCIHIPTAENIAGHTTTHAASYFASLTDADQDKYFTSAGAQAIRDGADPAKVVNISRRSGLYTANGQTFTTEGTARGVLAGVARPTPQTIYENASSRAEAIDGLRRYGYLH